MTLSHTNTGDASGESAATSARADGLCGSTPFAAQHRRAQLRRAPYSMCHPRNRGHDRTSVRAARGVACIAERCIARARAGAALLALLALAAVLAACAGTSAHAPGATGTAGATSTAGGGGTASPTPAATATLPPLAPQQGWQAVLSLGESGTSTQSNDSFTASAPYIIEWACVGSGSFKITYGSTSATTACDGQPTVHTTQTLTPDPPGQQVAVTAAGQGDVSWEVLVAMQG